jgi:hypothetical protein
MANYRKLMNRIDRQSVAREVANPIWMALKGFPLRGNQIKSHEELVEVVSRFMHHLHREFLKLPGDVEMPPDMVFGMALELLRVQNLAPFFDQCLRGINGGVMGLLQRITEQFERQMIRRYVDHVFETEISNPMDYDEIEALMTEYHRHFGQYLPFQLRSVPALCMNWREVLMEHADLLARARGHVGAAV